MRNTNPQLSLEFKEGHRGRFQPTRPLAKHRLCQRVLSRLHYVQRFFPELSDRIIRVGITRVASGMAVAGGNELWFNPYAISNHVVAHELIHLLQGHEGIPSGERACDVYALARHWTLNDTAPCYVRVPAVFRNRSGLLPAREAKLLYDTAARAIHLRQSGKRTYIAYFESELKKTAVTLGLVHPAASPANPGLGLPGESGI